MDTNTTIKVGSKNSQWWQTTIEDEAGNKITVVHNLPQMDSSMSIESHWTNYLSKFGQLLGMDHFIRWFRDLGTRFHMMTESEYNSLTDA